MLKKSLSAFLLVWLFLSPTPVLAIQVLGASDEDADLRIGCLYPMTGPSGLWGRDAAEAIAMALDELEQAGPNSPKLRIYIEDSMGRQSRSREISQQLITDHRVDILCGIVNSNIALEISRLALDTQTLFIGSGHSSSRLTEEARHPWYFRVHNDARQSMHAGALYLKELQQSQPWTSLAFVGPDYEYGHQIWQLLLDSLDQLNVDYEIKSEYYSLLGEPDFTPYIRALKRDPPDILISGHWTHDMVNFVEQAEALQLFGRTRLANFDTGGGYFSLSRLGNKMPAGVIMSARSHINWPDTERNKNYVESFYQRAKRYPTFLAQDAYSVIMAIDAAWQIAETQDSNGLRKALEGLKLSLPEDPAGFQSWIDPESHQIMQVQAVGETLPDDRFTPASKMVGNWKIYYPELPPR